MNKNLAALAKSVFPQGIPSEVTGSSLRLALSTLTPREQKVLHMYFGIDEERKYTLAEIGEYFGVTDGRARLVKNKALRKLQDPNRYNH